jgi:L-lysine exporter family protein LysE/ArgO
MNNLIPPALAGFALMGGLIVAIGAQNAFILRQGLLRANVALLVTLAAGLDACLIIAGTAGFGSLIHAHVYVLKYVSWAGAIFLVAYGLLAVRRALSPASLTPSEGARLSPLQATRTLMAVSLLNPHVYLDTVVLVGGIAGRYPGLARMAYTLGAIAASVLWFSALGFGARLLGPIFAKPLSWRLLDAAIALIMFLIAASLVQTALTVS